MKTFVALSSVLMISLFAWFAFAAQPAGGAKVHRVVFQVTTDGSEQWDAMLGNVENVQQAFGAENTEVVIVAHGKGLGLLMTAGNPVAGRMKMLADGGRTAFVACENTMKKKNVSKDQLLPFAKTVDAGVAEVVRKQEQGWAYIKSGT